MSADQLSYFLFGVAVTAPIAGVLTKNGPFDGGLATFWFVVMIVAALASLAAGFQP